MPTAMLKANGTYEPGKHGQRLEADGIPSTPTVQSANETFDWLVKKLDDLGVVAEVDAMALQMLADAWEDYQVARNVIKEQGPTYHNGARRFDVATTPGGSDDEPVVGKGGKDDDTIWIDGIVTRQNQRGRKN